MRVAPGAPCGHSRESGDDLDEAILKLVLAKVGKPRLDAPKRRRLLDECRRQKEGVGPNTRRLVIDLEMIGKAPVVVPMDDLYEACEPSSARRSTPWCSCKVWTRTPTLHIGCLS
jgi:hypothetical protein